MLHSSSVALFANMLQSFAKEFTLSTMTMDLLCPHFLDSVVEAQNKWVPVSAALKMSVFLRASLRQPCVPCLLVCADPFCARAILRVLLLAILSTKFRATPPVTHLLVRMDSFSPLLLWVSLVPIPRVVPPPCPTRVLSNRPTFLIPSIHPIQLCA